MAGSKQVPASPLTKQDSSAFEELGSIRVESDGKEYRFVRCITGAVKKGRPCGFTSSNNNTVSPSITASDNEDRPAGVGIASINSGNYGWIQRRGYNAYIKTDGGVAANALFYKDSNVANKVTDGADGVQALGVSVGADSGTFQVAGAWLLGL